MNIDTIWLILCSMLVFLMQPGFMCLESGLTRTKNSINVAFKNLLDFGISGLLFWLFGCAIAFGNIFSGNLHSLSPEAIVFFIFQMMFCSTATTIVSGATAERLKLSSYAIIVIITSGLIYPVFTNWAWYGANNNNLTGFLGGRGFIDFAGSTVIHSVGGWVSLAVLLIIGSRDGRFTNSRKSPNFSGSNLPFAILGVFLILLGWLGFNGGSSLEFSDRVPLIILNTILAAIAGMIGAVVIESFRLKTAKVETLINGCLSGLVSITACCHVVAPQIAIIIGFIGGIITIIASHCLKYFHIDDAVDAIPVHLIGGIWGTIAVSLYGDLGLLATELSRGKLFLIQLFGIIVCGLWSFGVTWIILNIVNKFSSLRVSQEAEERGLNITEHQAKNSTYEMLEIMNRQAENLDLNLRVPVEPFTEIGFIARHYNYVIDRLALSTKQLQQFNLSLEEIVKQRTKELIIAKDKAEIANRAKSTFIANMNHELRTPLNAILGFTQLIDRSQELSSEQQNNLNIISRSGEHLLTLINNILDLAKIESGKMTLNIKSFNLDYFFEDLRQMFTLKAATKGLELEFIINPKIPKCIKTDYTKLKQIIINLLNNAIKFTDIGKVTLRADLKSNNCLAIEVEDTGHGIAETELDELFQAFTQTKTGLDIGEGTGLGLSICHKFIELMKGNIVVESEPGSGSIFKLVLPVQVESTSQILSDETLQPVRKVVALAANQPQYRILIVDDRLDNRRLLSKLLKPLGFETKEAENGKIAIDLWEAWQPHLICMDLKMPIMDGYQAIEYIKNSKLSDHTKIIAITASATAEEKAKVLAMGCEAFMYKPFKVVTLFDALALHLGVEFIYEETKDKEPEDNSILSILNYNSFVNISQDLLAELKHSLIEVDLEAIENVVEKISQENNLLARTINKYLYDFNYESILNTIPEK